jgi:hypothetical protein
MPIRLADAFFYGLFMDQDLLRAKGLAPENAEPSRIARAFLL